MNRKRVHRWYRLEGLQVRMRVKRRKHMALHRGPAPLPERRGERWSMDFVHDALISGRPFRVLTTVDQGKLTLSRGKLTGTTQVAARVGDGAFFMREGASINGLRDLVADARSDPSSRWLRAIEPLRSLTLRASEESPNLCTVCNFLSLRPRSVAGSDAIAACARSCAIAKSVKLTRPVPRTLERVPLRRTPC